MPTQTDMECWKTTLNVHAFPRMEYLYDKLHGKLDTFKRSLPPEPKAIRDVLTSGIDNVFCATTLFVVEKTKDGGSSDVQDFLSKHMCREAGTPDRCSVDEMCRQVKDDNQPSMPLVLLTGEADAMNTDCEEVIRMLKAHCLDEKSLRRMLFVIDEHVTSRSQMYDYVDTLVTNNSDVSFSDECKGSRIFHRHDKMLLKLISQYLEKNVGKNIGHLYSLCKMPLLRQDDENKSKELVRVYLLDVFKSTHDKLCDLAKQVTGQQLNRYTECEKQINTFLGNILPRYGVLVTKQALMRFCHENNSDAGNQSSFGTIRSQKRYFLLEYLSSTSSSMFSGIVTGRIMFSRGKVCQCQHCGSPDAIAKRIHQIVVNDRQHISTAMSNEIQQASRALRRYIDITTAKAQEIFNLFNNIVSERFSDEVPIGAQISLCRIPGLKSFGYWKGAFEVSVCEDQWKNSVPNLMQVLHEAVRGQSIARENIHFRSRDRELQFHLYTGESGRQCYGSVTLFGKRIGDGQLVCFTCKHVVPMKNARVTMFDNVCDHTEVDGQDCECKLFTGVCIHTHGVEDSNQLGDGFVDISCVHVQEPCPIDTSIQGPTPGRKRIVCPFDGNFRQHRGMDVYKKGIENRTAYGKYVDTQYLTPSEDADNDGDQGLWDCGHDHSVNIPFSDGPRKIDLIEESEDSEVSFGDRGHSGGLVSFLSRNENTDEVTPALVYVGKWPDRDKTYMCYRLHEAIDCLTLNDISAQFSLQYDDDNFRDIHE